MKHKADDLTPSAKKVGDYHDTFWKHCLRCGHCIWRTSTDVSKRKSGGVVPRGGMLLDGEILPVNVPNYFMLEYPDEAQQLHGRVHGSGEDSPFLLALRSITDSLQYMLPEGFVEGLGIGFALGCQPVDLSNTALMTRPSAAHAKACRPRWQTELAAANPYLTYISGPSALAVIAPSYRTKYKIARGEVLEAAIWDTRTRLSSPEEISTPIYVGASLEVTLRTAREDQWDLSEWEPYPCQTPLTEPVQDFLWHFLWYAWLSSAIKDMYESPEHKEFDDRFLDLVDRLNHFYESQSLEVFDIERFLRQYHGSEEVRKAMTKEGDEVFGETMPSDDLDDDDEEE